ncbi:hypothetical protein J6590_029247 [Homalodisca vitripennis]|nr:hypothetical protein J6590_029247 [Homalodisca vitripennis]
MVVSQTGRCGIPPTIGNNQRRNRRQRTKDQDWSQASTLAHSHYTNRCVFQCQTGFDYSKADDKFRYVRLHPERCAYEKRSSARPDGFMLLLFLLVLYPHSKRSCIKARDFRTTTGRAGGLLARTGSLSGHHARRYLIRLSYDNRCTRYTTPLANGERAADDYDIDLHRTAAAAATRESIITIVFEVMGGSSTHGPVDQSITTSPLVVCVQPVCTSSRRSAFVPRSVCLSIYAITLTLSLRLSRDNRISNVERDCCLDVGPLSDPGRPLAVVRKSPLSLYCSPEIVVSQSLQYRPTLGNGRVWQGRKRVDSLGTRQTAFQILASGCSPRRAAIDVVLSSLSSGTGYSRNTFKVLVIVSILNIDLTSMFTYREVTCSLL